MMHGERRGEGNSLAQKLGGCVLGLQPREGFVPQALVHVVKGCHDFRVPLACCICEVH